MPDGETLPEIWILGSSDQSAIFAAYFGRAFSFAHFITDEGGPQIMAAYKAQFRPSAELAVPQASIGVFVICAESEERAQYLAASRDLSRLRQRQGMPMPFPPPEEALAYPYTDIEQPRRRTSPPPPDRRHAGHGQARSSKRSPPATASTRSWC